jgi:hypothetical protein
VSENYGLYRKILDAIEGTGLVVPTEMEDSVCELCDWVDELLAGQGELTREPEEEGKSDDKAAP